MPDDFICFALYLIEILHQTTTSAFRVHHVRGCILLKFYIKPQLWEDDSKQIEVVSY